MGVQKISRGTATALTVRAMRCLAAIALTITLTIGFGVSSSRAADDVWSGLKHDLYGDRVILDGKDRFSIEAPYRAHDAALVPVTIKAKQPLRPGSYIKAITLVIDQNPAPVAAVFTMAPDSAISSLSTRVRVNAYSELRAIAELNDGKLYMVKRFVKASGGCSAPANKNADAARSQLGRMKLRQFAQSRPAAGQSRLAEAQIMIRHPNNSGLQMDQVTGYYIPAHFVDKIAISQAGRLLLSIEGAISLSENPAIRFNFRSRGNAKLKVRASDTEQNIFQRAWDFKPGAKPGS